MIGRWAHEASRRDAATEAACTAQTAEAERKRRSMVARNARQAEAESRDLEELEGRHLAEEGARLQQAREDARRVFRHNQVEVNRLKTAVVVKERQAQDKQRQAEVAMLQAIAEDQHRENHLVQVRNRFAAAEAEKANLEANLRSQEQDDVDRKVHEDAKGRRLSAEARALEKQWMEALSAKHAARDRGSFLEKQASDLRSREAREQAAMLVEQPQQQAALAAAKARAERRGSDLRRKQAAFDDDKLRSEKIVAQRVAAVQALEEEAAKRKASALALEVRRRELREGGQEKEKDMKEILKGRATPRVASGTRTVKFPPRRSMTARLEHNDSGPDVAQDLIGKGPLRKKVSRRDS